jgi:uncharacterized SAM-binding protein YcdF (DUF218 family)
MDLVLIQKFIAHLAYPAGLIGLLGGLALICRILYLTKSALRLATLAILIFLICSNNYVAHHLAKSLEQQHPQFSIDETPNADAMIVLGGSLSPPVNPRKFSQLSNTSNRFWLASKLYKAKKADYIILSGGNVFEHNGVKPESHYIKEWLLNSGIPESAILIDDKSRTTRENALETQKILNVKQAKTALLITSAIHMPRSLQLFSELDTNIIPTPSDLMVTDYNNPSILRIIPSSGALNLTTQSLHEYYGMWAETIKRTIKKIYSN